MAAERGRVMSGGGGRTRPRYVGRWRPNAAAPCRAVAAERGRAMSGGGGRTRPRHVVRWRPRAAAPCLVALMGHGSNLIGAANIPAEHTKSVRNTPDVFSPTTRAAKIRARRQTLKTRMARETKRAPHLPYCCAKSSLLPSALAQGS